MGIANTANMSCVHNCLSPNILQFLRTFKPVFYTDFGIKALLLCSNLYAFAGQWYADCLPKGCIWGGQLIAFAQKWVVSILLIPCFASRTPIDFFYLAGFETSFLGRFSCKTFYIRKA